MKLTAWHEEVVCGSHSGLFNM